MSPTDRTSRVLVVCPSSVAGGAERALLGLARHLPELGFVPIFVALQPGPLCEWLRELDRDVYLIEAGRTRHLLRTALAMRRLAELARATRASVVFSNQPKGHVFGGMAALLTGLPAVWCQTGIPDACVLERCAARIPAVAIVCGSDPALLAQRRLSPDANLFKIYPGTDIERVRRAKGAGMAIRRRLGWADRDVVGVIGRLQPGKGQEIFIRAMGHVAARRPDARFLVVGGALLGWEGDYPDRLRALGRQVGLGDRIHFAGHQDDAYPWFDACDVVVNPSFGEGFGLVVVEAMTLGKPVVSTAVGGPAEIIQDGLSGLLVPARDYESVAEAVDLVLSDPTLAAALGAAAAERAQRFSGRDSAELFADLFRRFDRRPHRPIDRRAVGQRL